MVEFIKKASKSPRRRPQGIRWSTTITATAWCRDTSRSRGRWRNHKAQPGLPGKADLLPFVEDLPHGARATSGQPANPDACRTGNQTAYDSAGRRGASRDQLRAARAGRPYRCRVVRSHVRHLALKVAPHQFQLDFRTPMDAARTADTTRLDLRTTP